MCSERDWEGCRCKPRSSTPNVIRHEAGALGDCVSSQVTLGSGLNSLTEASVEIHPLLLSQVGVTRVAEDGPYGDPELMTTWLYRYKKLLDTYGIII